MNIYLQAAKVLLAAVVYTASILLAFAWYGQWPNVQVILSITCLAWAIAWVVFVRVSTMYYSPIPIAIFAFLSQSYWIGGVTMFLIVPLWIKEILYGKLN